MKDFIILIKRFLPPYKKLAAWNLLANIFYGLLNIFTFALLIPILNILFNVDKAQYHYMKVDTSDIINLFSILKNNFFWYLSEVMQQYSAGAVLLLLGGILAAITVVRVTAMFFGAYSVSLIRTSVVRDIRKQINDKILSLPLKFFSNERKGDIIARMTGDVGEVENSVMNSLEMVTKNPVLIIINLITLLFLSWQLTIFVFLLLPVAGYIMGKIGKSLKKQSVEAQNLWGFLISQIEETVGGLRVILAFNAQKKIEQRFNTSNDTLRKMLNRVAARQQLAHPMSELLGTITLVLVLWFGGILILDWNTGLQASQFILYLTIFYMTINPAKDLSKAAYAIQKGMASVQRIDKILTAQNDILEPEEPKKLTFKEGITYRNVSFKYDTLPVLDNVSITIPKGKKVALVGQSGSGKSTLVDLLPRFYDVEEGGIFIDEVNIKEATTTDLRSLMGNVNQEAILFNDSFFNNIAFGVENATMEQVVEAAKVANAHDFITASEKGYETNIGDRGSKLSGGQRQRISIARAILKNPQILILDEATSALDTESEKLVQDALENLMKNRTTLVIAHRLSTIKDADIIYVMHEARVVEQGNHNDLYEQNGYYRRLCDMQQF
jgi:ABC-type multidrug transport system fused ATPase/permease subunit